MEENLKMRIIKWVDKIGREEAEKRLLAKGVNLSIAQKLLARTYPFQPKATILKQVLAAMKRG